MTPRGDRLSQPNSRAPRSSRVTIYPREAAALDRLLDAYLAQDQNGGHDQDPGYDDLLALRARVRKLPHDHAAYDVARHERG